MVLTTAPAEPDKVRWPYISSETVWAAPAYSTVLVAPKVLTMVVPVTIPDVPVSLKVAPLTTSKILLVAMAMEKPPLLKTPVCILISPVINVDVTAVLTVTVDALLENRL